MLERKKCQAGTNFGTRKEKPGSTLWGDLRLRAQYEEGGLAGRLKTLKQTFFIAGERVCLNKNKQIRSIH